MVKNITKKESIVAVNDDPCVRNVIVKSQNSVYSLTARYTGEFDY